MTGADIIKRHASMDSYAIGNWMNMWQECADWVLPTNDNVNRVRIQGQEKTPQRLIDIGIEANYNWAQGFFSRMFPINTIWAKFKHPDPAFMDIPAVADYYERVSRIINNILVNSNFAQEEIQSLLGLGCFGTSCVSVEASDAKVVKFSNYMIGKVRIAENYEHIIDTVSREFELDARQAKQQFGEEALKKAELGHILVEEKTDQKYKFIHYVCPRSDFDKDKKDKKNKPIASFYVSKDSGQTISESGFDFMPYVVSRFDTGNDEVYGRSPTSMKLGTFRRANVAYRSITVAAEQNTNAQWLVSDDDTTAQKYITARSSLIKYRASSPGGKPERLQSNGDPSLGDAYLDKLNEEIKRAFFNAAFRPLDDHRNMTALEASERVNTELMELAPFASRYKSEKLSPLMGQVYYFAQKAGKLPPPPPELDEAPQYEVDYIGKIAMASKNSEALGAIQTLQIFGELSQIVPQLAIALDNVNPDRLFRTTWYSNSADMGSMKDPKKVEDKRAAEKQAFEQQQQIQNAPALADAVQKLSGEVSPKSIIAQAEQNG